MQISERANFVLRNLSFRQYEKGTRFIHFSDYKSKLSEIEQAKVYLLKLASGSEKYLTMPDLNSNQKFILRERKSFFGKLFRFTVASYVCLMSQIMIMTTEDIHTVLSSLLELDSIEVKHPNDKISQSYIKVVQQFLCAKTDHSSHGANQQAIFECIKELYRVTLNELAYLDSLQELRMFESMHSKIKNHFQSARKAVLQPAKSVGEFPTNQTNTKSRKIGISRSKTFVMED